MGKTLTLALINYNKAPYIPRALQSILEQSYKPDQVIVYDDCSTDGGDELLKAFAHKHHGWVKFVQSEFNMGRPAVSVNRALEHVKTELWADMSADDFMHPDCLKHLVTRFDQGSCDLIIANVTVVDRDGNELGPHFPYIPSDDEALHAVLEYRVNSARQKLVSMEFTRRIGNYNQNLSTHEDHDFLVRAALDGRIAYCEEAVYYWRRFEGNLTSTLSTNSEEWQAAFRSVYSTNYRMLRLSRKLGISGALKARRKYREKVGLIPPKNVSVDFLRKNLLKIPGIKSISARLVKRSN